MRKILTKTCRKYNLLSHFAVQICCVFAQMSTGETDSKGLDQTHSIIAEISSDFKGFYIRLHNLEDNLAMK